MQFFILIYYYYFYINFTLTESKYIYVWSSLLKTWTPTLLPKLHKHLYLWSDHCTTWCAVVFWFFLKRKIFWFYLLIILTLTQNLLHVFRAWFIRQNFFRDLTAPLFKVVLTFIGLVQIQIDLLEDN